MGHSALSSWFVCLTAESAGRSRTGMIVGDHEILQ